MKKLMLTGVLAVFALAVVSCGGHGSCDAYRAADYTKYKAEKKTKIELKKLVDVNRKSSAKKK